MNMRMMFSRLHTLLVLLSIVLLASCSAGTSSPAMEDVQAQAPGDSGGWPREFTDGRGQTIVVNEPPQRIVTLSLGLDEITMALVGPERFAAISEVARSEFGNIAAQAAKIPVVVSADVESVLAADPDILLLDGYYNPDLLKQVEAMGLTVAVVDLHDSLEEYMESIRLLAYIYGVEDRGEELIAEIESRIDRLETLVNDQLRDSERIRLMHITSGLFTPGSATTNDDIIRLAGGINVVAEAGLQGWQQITLEKVIELAPDALLFDDYDAGQQEFRRDVLENPALSDVPAIRNRRLCQVPHRYISTLSFWNIRGAEELARCLWDLTGVDFKDFD